MRIEDFGERVLSQEGRLTARKNCFEQGTAEGKEAAKEGIELIKQLKITVETLATPVIAVKRFPAINLERKLEIGNPDIGMLGSHLQ